MKGDWELPLIFAVVPTLGVLYALLTGHEVGPLGSPLAVLTTAV